MDGDGYCDVFADGYDGPDGGIYCDVFGGGYADILVGWYVGPSCGCIE